MTIPIVETYFLMCNCTQLLQIYCLKYIIVSMVTTFDDAWPYQHYCDSTQLNIVLTSQSYFYRVIHSMTADSIYSRLNRYLYYLLIHQQSSQFEIHHCVWEDKFQRFSLNLCFMVTIHTHLYFILFFYVRDITSSCRLRKRMRNDMDASCNPVATVLSC